MNPVPQRGITIRDRTVGAANSPPSGFALVVTLSLMVLLTLLAVGLLGLSSVSLRSAAHGEPLAEARANARLALLLALNELQLEAGPDQRITAPAAVTANDGTGKPPNSASFEPRTTEEGFAHPRWLGIWDSWTKWLNDTGIDKTYGRGRRPNFRRWLVSTPDPDSLRELSAARRGFSGGKLVEVVGAGTVGKSASQADHVSVPLVAVSSSRKGGYGWWVSGNNQRALINAAAPSPAAGGSVGTAANRLADQPSVGLDWLAGLAKLPTDPAILGKCQTVPTLAVTAPGARLREVVKGKYHDLTAYSVGLPVNVRDGMLKNDLNLLLELPALPPDYGSFRRSNPGGTIMPIREHNGLGRAPQYPQNINLTSWYKLQQYYQLALGGSAAGSDESSADCAPVGFSKGLWWNGNAAPNINFNWEIQNLDYYGWGRTPIVSRLMIIFSLRRVASIADATKFAYKMSYNPVLVLWNPYNVTLHSPPLWLAFTPGSLQFKAYKNNTPDGDWKPLARDASEGGLGSGALFDVAVQQSAGAPNRPIILKPGETRIFSASDPAADTRQRILLTPGYKAPTDNGGFDVTLPGLNDIPAGTTVQLTMRLNDQRTDHGGQYQMYWTMRNATTGESQRFNELAANPVKDGNPISIIEDKEGKRLSFGTNATRLPFASFEFVLKSGEDLRNAGRGYDGYDFRGKNFIHSKPWNNRSMYGEATDGMKGMAQYDVHVAVGSGNQLNPDFEANTNRSYVGSAISLGSGTYPGQTIAPMTEIPLVPPTSLAGFMHFRLNPGDSRDFASGRHLWEVSTNDALSIGSSFANPLIAGNSIYADVADAACRGAPIQMKLIRDHHDHVFLNNDALWDRWLCSGVATQASPAFPSARKPKAVLQDFFEKDQPLPNRHYAVDRSQMTSAKETIDELFGGRDPSPAAHRQIARYLTIIGAFNVNSTSVEAWKAVLGGLREEQISYLDPASGTIQSQPAPEHRVVLSRFSLPSYPTEGANAGDPAAWGGVRLLTEAQIDRLAAECVRQVKLRGPFLNLADFVNRRLANDETGLCGALQAAIDWDEYNQNSPGSYDSINGRFKNASDMVTAAQVATWRLNFPAAGTGSRWTGIPGYLTQADVLRRLGDFLTVRDDTFTIRTYGEARDERGAVVAQAWCEAVVVRARVFLDPGDPPDTAAIKLLPSNQRFGRRFEIISFRWLQASDI
ncbi:MAG: hypothetical protein K9N23_12440 [Akkermansiaceae bacterium]|nr:hypothetical protein [Akkermansiaceae bacterium]